MKDEISTIKGVFVFAATIIGAGILALPVAAAKTGFFPMLLFFRRCTLPKPKYTPKEIIICRVLPENIWGIQVLP
jgi:hypothetical protein